MCNGLLFVYLQRLTSLKISEDVDWNEAFLVFLRKHNPQAHQIWPNMSLSGHVLAYFVVLHFIKEQKYEKNNYIESSAKIEVFVWEKWECNDKVEKKFIFFFYIFLLNAENFPILFKWNIIPLMNIFLTRSHSLDFINVILRNLKNFWKCHSFWDFHFKWYMYNDPTVCPHT